MKVVRHITVEMAQHYRVLQRPGWELLTKWSQIQSKIFLSGRNEAAVQCLQPCLFPEEDSDEGQFFVDVLNGLQRWFSMNGWPGALNPIIIPDSFRNGLTRKIEEMKSKNGKCTNTSSAAEKVTQTIYDMISHLSGKSISGANPNCALPSDPVERVTTIYSQHCSLLTFVRNQGGCVANIKPEFLLEPRDYRQWMKTQETTTEQQQAHQPAVDDVLFELLSKRAWMDLLLQIVKTLVLSKITPRQLKNMPTPYKNVSLPTVDVDPLCSNIYSLGERIILAWLNQHYEQMRHVVWSDPSVIGGVPSSRWIVNFDFNLLDSLVLAAVLAAYAPFLIKSHLVKMYTRPTSAEQCLHNALCVVGAMRSIGIDYDILAIDLTDPNPICMLLLCIHLYFNMPNYLPKNVIQFEGPLHGKVSRQIKLSNPSSKPTVYNGILCGRDARDFVICKGSVITIPPKSSTVITVDFHGRFMRPSEAVLILAGRRYGATVGCTLAFTLNATVNTIVPQSTVECESPCFIEKEVVLTVTNCFQQHAKFLILLVEINGEFPSHSQSVKELANKILPGGDDTSVPPQNAVTHLRAFFSVTQTVQVAAGKTERIAITFLPFTPGPSSVCSHSG
jgi:hypothetical protein